VRGPYILFAVSLCVAALFWWALVGDKDADLKRGLAECEVAFTALEDELRALDVVIEPLVQQGWKLSLRAQHDKLTSELASLQVRRLDVRNDNSLRKRERLPLLREVVTETDELLALAMHLRSRVAARFEFQTKSSPLLGRSRALRDLLLSHLATSATPPDADLRRRVDGMSGTFADLEQGAIITDGILAKNLEQGRTLGGANLIGLKNLIVSQEALAAELGLTIPAHD
jgi:hypothetical protein